MDNRKSSVTNASGPMKSTLTRNQRMHIPTMQNIHIIWLDGNIDNNNADCRNTISQLRRTVNKINAFTDSEECIQFINNIIDNKICMIISGLLGQNIVPQIHNMSQIDSIFIFCSNKTYHKQWAKDWTKIHGVFTEIESICEALKQIAQQCERNVISISFVATDNDIFKKDLNQLDPIFIYSQILKEILLTTKFEDRHIKKFIDYCREVFAENDKKLKNVDQLQTEYYQKTPIWWYTSESFLCSMLNYSLQLMSMNIIIKMSFFITDLHHQIEQLHSEQFAGKNFKKSFIIYHGQGMSKAEFEQMTKTQGGLISFNNFLLANKKRENSLRFAHRAVSNIDMIGILFVMSIDPKKSTTPFAFIGEVSCFEDQEDEVLFSMYSIFRIGEIKPMNKNERLFQVNLSLTDDNDKDLRLLFDHIQIHTDSDEEGWYRMGSILLKTSETVRASQVYETLLEQASDASEKARVFNQIGLAKYDYGEYQEAFVFFEKALEIQKESFPSNHPDLAISYSNIGLVYDEMGDYPTALFYQGKAQEIQKQSFCSNHPDLAYFYNNIGNLYYKMRDYLKALSYYEKALEIQKESLLSNHPDLACSYNNIGMVYDSMGDYPKAISYQEKALEIQKQLVSSNNPVLAYSYNRIGLAYYHINDYPKALLYYEKAVEIQNQSLSVNHSDLAKCYISIGNVYSRMGDYPKALSFNEKALEIQQQSCPSNHPDLSASYNNIGATYELMNNYANAYSFYEQAVEIGQKTLTENNSNLQMCRRNFKRIREKL